MVIEGNHEKSSNTQTNWHTDSLAYWVQEVRLTIGLKEIKNSGTKDTIYFSLSSLISGCGQNRLGSPDDSRPSPD